MDVWAYGTGIRFGSRDSQRINRYFGAAVGLPEAPERFLHGMYTDDNNLINYSMPAGTSKYIRSSGFIYYTICSQFRPRPVSNTPYEYIPKDPRKLP